METTGTKYIEPVYVVTGRYVEFTTFRNLFRDPFVRLIHINSTMHIRGLRAGTLYLYGIWINNPEVPHILNIAKAANFKIKEVDEDGNVRNLVDKLL